MKAEPRIEKNVFWAFEIKVFFWYAIVNYIVRVNIRNWINWFYVFDQLGNNTIHCRQSDFKLQRESKNSLKIDWDDWTTKFDVILLTLMCENIGERFLRASRQSSAALQNAFTAVNSSCRLLIAISFSRKLLKFVTRMSLMSSGSRKTIDGRSNL